MVYQSQNTQKILVVIVVYHLLGHARARYS